MTAAITRLSLDGMMDFIPKSRRPLAPVFEATSNALEAIAERQEKGALTEPGRVTLRFNYTGLLQEARDLEQIEVIDNGIGFDNDNFSRFETFLDRGKGFNNRGSGRVQFLHFAEKLTITSHFRADDGRNFTRRFLCSPKAFITDATVLPTDSDVSIGTTIVMSGFLHKDEVKTYFDELTLADLRCALRSHYMLRLHLAREATPATAPSLHIEFVKNGKLFDSGLISSSDIPIPTTGDIEIPYVKAKDAKADKIVWVPQRDHVEHLTWAHFKLGEADLAENGVVLCSKGIVVDRLRFEGLKKFDTVNDHRYLTAIYGPVLDRRDHVSHTVDRFTLPTRADTEKAIHEDLLFDPDKPLLFIDDIKQAVQDVLPRIYAELCKLKLEQQRGIEAIAKAHGIPTDIVRATKIGLTDNEEQITEKLFKKQAETLAEQSVRIKKLFEALDKLDPADENYQAELEEKSSELLNLIPEQNKQELSRYVIRRQMVAKILGKILDGKIVPAAKSKKTKCGRTPPQDKEGLIHDLLIRRGESTANRPHDLWVLSEEFVHFEGCSNLRIDQIKDSHDNKLLRSISKADIDKYGIRTTVKPDIFLFVAEAQCVLIELKAPDVNLSEYLNQLPMYCNLIANFSLKPITRFYCYLVGETLNPIEIGGDYRQTVDGDFVRRADYPIMRYEDGRQEQEIGKAHIEIIKLSSLHQRALRRNKSFADRLGISDEALEPAK